MATDASHDTFHAKTSDFLKWLRERPGTTISRKIEIVDLRDNNAGRGIVTVKDVEEDEELFTIAQSNVLTVQNSSLQKVMPHLLERLDSWNSLVLVMIHDDGLGKDSPWWDYLQLLPTEFNTLIYWSSSELAELEGSAVLNKIGKDDADASFKKLLLPIVHQHPEVFGRHAQEFRGSNASTVLLDLAHRMATLIMAYGFDIGKGSLSSSSEEEEEEEEADGSSQSAYELNKGLVPLADLFNADGDSNNAHLIQHGDAMTMVALKPIPKGQQIFNDFGQLPRSDLLRRYGYVTDSYRKWDVVEVDIETILSATGKFNQLDDREQAARLQLAATWEVLQDGYDLSRPEEGSFEFEQQIILTITALLLDTNAAKQATVTTRTPNQPPPFVLTRLGLVLKEIITCRLKAYKTTLAEDIALLEDLTVQGRRRMAIEVRLGEKEILSMAALRVDETVADIGRSSRDDEDTSHVKRRKL